jgi:hypothetical protein
MKEHLETRRRTQNFNLQSQQTPNRKSNLKQKQKFCGKFLAPDPINGFKSL